MYGWIIDGISSLFEPVKRQNPSEWPEEGNLSGTVPTRPGVKTAAQQSHGRPAKRQYKSVHVAEGVCQSEGVEVKRPRRDIVISFVKKTVTGVVNLLGLRKPLKSTSEKPKHYEDTQPVTLLGIDELHTSWLNSTQWRMDKSGGGKNPFQSSLPAFTWKYSGTTLPAGHPDRGKDRERRSSLQLLPSRSTVRVGTTNPDPTCSGFGHGRCYKPSLAVEEAIKQNDKEHYRRLLEMVTEKYSKNQPLPFNQSKPQKEFLSQVDHRIAASGKKFELVPAKMGHTATQSVFTWRHAPSTKDKWSGLTFSKSVSGAAENTQPARCTKKQAAELDLSTEVATRLNLVDKDIPTVSVIDTPAVPVAYTRHSDEDIPRLTKEMLAKVSAALAQSDPNLVLSAAFKLRITQRDLATLQEGSWLSDEVMNFYFSLIMERGSGEEQQLKVYSFSTFFLPKLCGGGGGQPGGHAAVKRWTKNIDLFVFDLVLIPLHLGVHWALAVVDFKSKTVKSYDSMGQRHDDICSLLLSYLNEEHKAKKGREIDCAKWTVGSLKASEIPQQKNGSDCGVFTCKYADYIAKGKPLTFKQCHMPVFRKLMIWEILNQKLL
ncbi:sentrin-specific protease 2 isoform 2-T2 [Pholidichthys leucotaenia]